MRDLCLKESLSLLYSLIMFNFYPVNMALLFVLLAPSVFYEAEKEKKNGGRVEKKEINRTLLMLEKTGRWGVMVFFAVKFENVRHDGMLSYLVPSLFLFLYLLVWLILWKKPSVTRSLLLSLLPSLMFLSSALIDSNYILLLFTLLFAPSHTAVSIKEEKDNG